MSIMLPVMAMVGLTMFVAFRLGILRYMAVSRGEIDLRSYRLYQGLQEPDNVRANTRHLKNLFEAPLLFYVLIIVAYVAQLTGTLVVSLAWSYVALRFFHSYVHLTANNVLVRFKIFATSMLVLLVLWIIILINLLR